MMTEYLLALDSKTLILGISAITAIAAVHRNSIINRRRATVDLVLHQRSNQKLIEANNIVNPILSTNEITRYADDSKKDTPEREAILTILNNYEFICVGIKEKAFDINLYKRMSYGIVIRDWGCFKPFVYHLRQAHDRPTLFQEFEWLAIKFKKSKLKAYND